MGFSLSNHVMIDPMSTWSLPFGTPGTALAGFRRTPNRFSAANVAVRSDITVAMSAILIMRITFLNICNVSLCSTGISNSLSRVAVRFIDRKPYVVRLVHELLLRLLDVLDVLSPDMVDHELDDNSEALVADVVLCDVVLSDMVTDDRLVHELLLWLVDDSVVVDSLVVDSETVIDDRLEDVSVVQELVLTLLTLVVLSDRVTLDQELVLTEVVDSLREVTDDVLTLVVLSDRVTLDGLEDDSVVQELDDMLVTDEVELSSELQEDVLWLVLDDELELSELSLVVDWLVVDSVMLELDILDHELDDRLESDDDMELMLLDEDRSSIERICRRFTWSLAGPGN